MLALVDKFGCEVVYWRGLSVLSYPPTWAMSLGEAMAVGKALQGE